MFQLPTLMGRQPKAGSDCTAMFCVLGIGSPGRRSGQNRKKEGKKTSARKLKAREGLLGSALQMSSLAGKVHACSNELRNPISVTQLKCSTSWNFKTHFSLIMITGPWTLSNSNLKSSLHREINRQKSRKGATLTQDIPHPVIKRFTSLFLE